MQRETAGNAEELKQRWDSDPRWAGIQRDYTAEDVVRLRGTVRVEHTLARAGAERLWKLIQQEDPVRALGAVTGNQAVQMVHAGLEAVYLSGWQVAADGNLAQQTYPDMSLYPADSGPALCRRLNNALLRADQISHLRGDNDTHWMAPILADAEAGFGGNLNAFELMKEYISAGAAGVHFEDQLSSAKKCGHMGGKVLVHVGHCIEKLNAARLATDILDVPTLLLARTDANGAKLLTTNLDERDEPFITGERTVEGFFRYKGGLDAAIARGLAYAPYADLIWCETAHPDLDEARRFAEAIHEKHPGKPLAYNCSPSFNWRRYLDDATIAKFQRELGAMGYKFQFITLAGFHALNLAMFELAKGYKEEGMTAYTRLQEREFEHERKNGYSAVAHQSFVGARYFDAVSTVIMAGDTETSAMFGSTEEEQFTPSEEEASVG